MKNVSILGSTGSIGINTLDVLDCHQDCYRVFALSGWNNINLLYEQCLKFQPELAVISTPELAKELTKRLILVNCKTQVTYGDEALIEISSYENVDIVVAAIVGAVGLPPVFAAAQAGKRILLANKEALVISGRLLLDVVKKNGAELLPIDSEHNAILQSLPFDYAGDLELSGIEKIILTASGGPFYKLSKNELYAVTPEQACSHPNWNMGRKISVDSASLMNKGLEVIEAHWLFNAPASRLEVVLHPQSFIHSMVQYIDGSVLAQMGRPDMRTPIACALAWPKRIANNVSSVDWLNLPPLTFTAPDRSLFPCLQFAFDALTAGGDTAAILNAANEVAVEAFLMKQIGFMDIPVIISNTLDSMFGKQKASICLSELLECNRHSRQIAKQFVGNK